MNDRELLEFAAKAAGYEYKPQSSAIVIGGIPATWNPLEDDGDALRLAVMIGWEYCQDYINGGLMAARIDCSDEFAAVRRSITLAAAEIGRAM